MNTNKIALLLTLVLASCGCASNGYDWNEPFEATSGELVEINGQFLSDVQLTSFHLTYGAYPLPGRYWYDPVSGLWGVEGLAPAGFLYAGHDYGHPREDASNGQEPLWFNGRRLTTEEVQYISLLIGAPAQPGRYWFDGQGYVGIEGAPYALGNLHVAARSGGASSTSSTSSAGVASGGSGGGGDNFWSSMLGAGNSNADNTQGYVSVPGYGPVGYGF